MLITVIFLLSLLAAVGAGLGSGVIWVALEVFVGTFLSLALLVFLALLIICANVDMNTVREKDNKFFRWLVNLMCEAAFPILNAHLTISGTEQMPKDGRFLLVCNHINDMDPVSILRAFPKKQISFISKRENDKLFIVGPLLHMIACQPINRENDREALKTILRCIKMIQEDETSIAVFPEGYVSNDGLLRRFRHGVFKIAQRTNVPVVVCTVRNTDKIFSNARRLKHTHAYLNLVKVIYPEEYAGKSTVELSEMVYQLMAADLGPELCYQYPQLESEKGNAL